MDSKTVLEAVQNGSMSISEAERYFNRKAYEDMGYAKLDTYRELRSGFPEVVYCPNKPDAYLQAIYVRLCPANCIRTMPETEISPAMGIIIAWDIIPRKTPKTGRFRAFPEQREPFPQNPAPKACPHVGI